MRSSIDRGPGQGGRQNQIVMGNVAFGKFKREEKKTPSTFVNGVEFYLFLKYSSIAAAAVFPAPMARITVAAPVTASPPA